MFTRAELEYRSRACLAQLKLRVVVFSMAIALPPWIAIYILEKMRIHIVQTHAARAGGLLILAIYVIGVMRIFKRTQRDCDLVCPKCKGLLGPQLSRVSDEGDCKKCGEKLAG
jgi:hypothetical protein